MSVHSPSWMTRLRETHHGSLYIRISNMLSESLEFFYEGQHELHSSNQLWVKPFDKLIRPGCSSEAGFNVLALFSTCEGTITFRSQKNNTHRVTLSWEYGLFVCRGSANKLSFPNIFVSRHVFPGQKASILFYIMDPSQLKDIDLLSAWIIDFNLMEDILRFIQNEKNFSVGSEFPTSRQVTEDLRDFLRVKDTQIEIDLEEKEFGHTVVNHRSKLNILEPCKFLEVLAKKKNYPSEILVSSLNEEKYRLFLIWRIGCECYSYGWKLTEPIRLYSAFPGGHSNPRIPLTSILSHRGPQCGCMSSLNYPLKDKSTYEANDEIIRRAFGCLQFLSRVLDTIVFHFMNEKYGLNWLHTTCRIPTSHLWKNYGVKQSLDLEGILFVIISCWDETFENVFSEVGLSFTDLKDFQNYCVYWSSQELRHFTKSSVEYLEQKTELVAKATKQLKHTG